jgi:hypothetical protein
MTIPAELEQAADDVRYLLTRGYPRESTLQLVGNRYNLTRDLRHVLRRGVFGVHEAQRRAEKLVSVQSLTDTHIAVDGHNVLITIETALRQGTLLAADDGVIRDISAVSGNFRKGPKTVEALRLIIDLFRSVGPGYVLILLDAPISGSGELAADVRRMLADNGVHGAARAEKVPERTLCEFDGIVASSDRAVINRARAVFDLAGYIIQEQLHAPIVRLGISV